MRIWLDDFRKPPDWSWMWARTPAEVLALMRGDELEEIAFRAPDEDCVKVAQMLERGACHDMFKPVKWTIGQSRDLKSPQWRTQAVMESAERFWRSNGHEI